MATTKGAASTAVAGRSRREVQSGAVVILLVGDAPGYGCQWLSFGVLRFHQKRYAVNGGDDIADSVVRRQDCVYCDLDVEVHQDAVPLCVQCSDDVICRTQSDCHEQEYERVLNT